MVCWKKVELRTELTFDWTDGRRLQKGCAPEVEVKALDKNVLYRQTLSEIVMEPLIYCGVMHIINKKLYSIRLDKIYVKNEWSTAIEYICLMVA